MAKAKHLATPAELENDPSLRYHYYCYGEALLSDSHPEQMVRFWEYAKGGRIKLKTMMLAAIPGDFDPLTIRRRPTECKPIDEETKQAIVAGAHACYGSRHTKG